MEFMSAAGLGALAKAETAGQCCTSRCCHASIAGLMIFADRRRYAVALAGAGAFLNLYSPQAVLPLLAKEFGATEAGIALIMFASTFAVALTAPFTGVIADVLGRKRVITAAMIALVIPTVMSALSPNLETMIFWRFVQGLMLPPIFAVTIAYIGGEMPADEATGMTGTLHRRRGARRFHRAAADRQRSPSRSAGAMRSWSTPRSPRLRRSR